MTTFESDSHVVNASAADIRAFLANMENLEHLLPGERIENVVLSNDSASFKIKGLADINIGLEAESDERIVYKNKISKPFEFTLEVSMSDGGATSTCQVFFNADVNNFMGMMMKAPITNFLNDLGRNLTTRFEAS